MSKDPAFPFYAQDFLTGVAYLTDAEIGIYIKLLCKQWTDGQIPKKRLGLFLRAEWDDLSEELKSKFDDKGDYLINPRLEAERAKRTAFKKKQSINGKKGGRPRKTTKTKNPKESQSISQKKPLENESEYENENGYEKENENFEGGAGETLQTPEQILKSNVIQYEQLQKQFAYLQDFDSFVEQCSVKVQMQHYQSWSTWDYPLLWKRFQVYLSNCSKNLKHATSQHTSQKQKDGYSNDKWEEKRRHLSETGL